MFSLFLMPFDVFSDLGGTPQNRRPKVPQKGRGSRPVWRSFWVPLYLSQDTFRGTEFQYFSGYLPGAPQGTPKGTLLAPFSSLLGVRAHLQK